MPTWFQAYFMVEGVPTLPASLQNCGVDFTPEG